MICGAMLLLASCTTITKTSTTAEVPASLLSATVADLEVSPQRVSETYIVPAEVRRGGVSNVQHAAEQYLIDKNGNGCDLLVEPEYTMYKTNYFFCKRITKIEVSGRPAKYKNFRSLNDSVWCNPVFRAGYKDNTERSKRGLLGIFGK